MERTTAVWALCEFMRMHDHLMCRDGKGKGFWMGLATAVDTRLRTVPLFPVPVKGDRLFFYARIEHGGCFAAWSEHVTDWIFDHVAIDGSLVIATPDGRHTRLVAPNQQYRVQKLKTKPPSEHRMKRVCAAMLWSMARGCRTFPNEASLLRLQKDIARVCDVPINTDMQTGKWAELISTIRVAYVLTLFAM